MFPTGDGEGMRMIDSYKNAWTISYGEFAMILATNEAISEGLGKLALVIQHLTEEEYIDEVILLFKSEGFQLTGEALRDFLNEKRKREVAALTEATKKP